MKKNEGVVTYSELKWYSVDYKLPEDDRDVLVIETKLMGNRSRKIFIGYYDNKAWTLADTFDGVIKNADVNYDFYKITHWAYLPNIESI